MSEEVIIIIRHKKGRKRLLKRSLDSVKNQTYENISLSVLCMDFSKNDLKDNSYLSELNFDFSSLINIEDLLCFLQKSHAKFLCFLDDDDSWAPEYISRLISVLIKTNNKYSQVNAISCHSNKVNEICEGNRIIINDTQPWNHYIPTGPIDFDLLYYINSIPLSSCVFFKKIAVDLLYNHNVNSPVFFWPFIIDFLSKYDLWVINEPLSFYHFRENLDYEFGNYSIINNEILEIDYTLKLRSLMRNNSNSLLLNSLLYKIINKNIHHKLSYIEDKIKGMVK